MQLRRSEPAITDSQYRQLTSKPTLGATLRRWWTLGVLLLVFETLLLLIWSHLLWSRFDLGEDYALFIKAFGEVGSGNLHPFVDAYNNLQYYGPLTNFHLLGFPFLDNNFELAMFPLALINLVWHSSFAILAVQVLAAQAALVAAFRFGLELIEEASLSRGAQRWSAAGFFLLLVLSPWTLWAVSFDFHFEPVVVVFLVLALRDLYFGSWRWTLWAGLVLAGGDVTSIWLVGAGIGMLALSGRRRRIMSGAMALGGAIWLGVIFALHGAQGPAVSANYAYLLGGGPPAAGAGALLRLLVAIPRHIPEIFTLLVQRKVIIYRWIASGGVFGLASPLSFGTVLAVLGVNSLNQGTAFIDNYAAFQNFAAVVTLALGTLWIFLWAQRRAASKERAKNALRLVALLVLVQSLVYFVMWVPRAREYYLHNSAASANALQRVLAETPANAEVIATISIEGRFGERRYVYPFTSTFLDGQTIPLIGSKVVFVFYLKDVQGPQAVTMNREAIAEVINEFHPKVLLERDQVYAFLLTQNPAMVRIITLP